MALLSRLAVCGLILLQPLAAADDVRLPCDQQFFTTGGSMPIRAQRELGPLLSNDSSILGPNDSRWQNATERYQNYAPPHILLVVQPGLESDIPTIVHVATALVKARSSVVNAVIKLLKRKRSATPILIVSTFLSSIADMLELRLWGSFPASR